jgi:recombination protein RecT|tara:strand:+ start:905 stop:1702 length:798 start_codon:yes stop_codon:yes gene_type:complete
MSREITQYQDALVDRMPQIRSLLPERMDDKRFCRLAMGMIERTPKLQKCTPQSFVLAVMGVAELGLEPTLGMVYIIPYGTKATLQIGYQGMIQLARNSGDVLDIYAEIVREGDEFEAVYGTSRALSHRKTASKDAKITHVYAVAKLKGADPAFIVLDRADVEKRRAVSKAANSSDGPWKNWKEEMFKKTAIRALFKTLPKSTEMQRAAVLDDEGVMGRQASVGIIDVLPAAKPWDTPEPEKDAEGFVHTDEPEPEQGDTKKGELV